MMLYMIIVDGSGFIFNLAHLVSMDEWINRSTGVEYCTLNFVGGQFEHVTTLTCDQLLEKIKEVLS